MFTADGARTAVVVAVAVAATAIAVGDVLGRATPSWCTLPTEGIQ